MNEDEIIVVEDDDVSRQAIVDKLREYLGTPFHHQGRVKKIGIDCAGLIVCAARELGLFNYDERACYSMQPDGSTLCTELHRWMGEQFPAEEAKVGDVLVFWISEVTRMPQHVGIKTDRGFIHTNSDVGRVVEHGLTRAWTRRIVYAHKFPGVA